MVPQENLQEARLIHGIEVYGLEGFEDVVRFLEGKQVIQKETLQSYCRQPKDITFYYLLFEKFKIDNMVYITYTDDGKYKGRDMDKFIIEFYEKENGDIPVEEFLLSLDVKMRAKLVGIIKILQEKGNLLREPYSKYLDDGIFKLRGKVGGDITRVLYFFYYDGKIILTNGFVKKTQKTPKVEIERAKEYRDNYLERCVKNEKI